MDDEPIEVNCGGCGRRLLMTIEALRDLRTVNCADCAERRSRVQARSPHEGNDNAPLDACAASVAQQHQRLLRLSLPTRHSS